MDVKPWYTSKTLWFNIATVGLGIVQTLSQTVFVDSQWLVAINGIGNMILRVFFTSSAIQ